MFQHAPNRVNMNAVKDVHRLAQLVVKLNVRLDALIHVKSGVMEIARAIVKFLAPNSVKKVVLIHVRANV